MAKKKPKKNKTTKKFQKVQSIKRQISIYDKWIIWLCAAILIIIPLAVSLISNDMFDLVKLAAFRFLAAGIVFVWAARNWRKPKQIIWSWREALLGAFFLLLVVSTLLSIHVPTSIYGKYKRYEGLLTFITYLTIYFVALQTFKNKSQFRLMIEIISIVGGIIAFHGVLQFLGWDVIIWEKASNRSFSTFGNADILVGYLVLAFPCSIAAYLNYAKRRWLHGLMVLFITACLYTSFARGGWIGAVAAIICFAVLLGRKRLKASRHVIAIISAFLLIGLIILLIFSSSILISRLAPMLNFNSSRKDYSRIEIWKSGLRMIKDRPFFGQGPDTFRLASEHFETKQFVRMVDGKIVADNAHNDFIQLAAGMGLPAAVLIYIFYISWIVRSIGLRYRLADDEESSVLISAAVAAVAGYLATMVFEIGVVGSSSVFWLIMAVTAGYAYQENQVFKFKETSKLSRSLKLGLVACLVVLTVVNAGIAAAMYAGDIYFYKALRAGSIGNYDLAAEMFDKAAVFYPGNGRIMYEKTRLFKYLTSKAIKEYDRQAYKQYSQESFEAIQKAVETDPLEVDNKKLLSIIYEDLGRINDAKKTLDLIIMKSPNYIPAHMLYGELEEAQGHDTEALNHYETVVGLTSTLAYPKVYSHMAKLYRKAGNTKKAAIYETAIRLNKPVNR